LWDLTPYPGRTTQLMRLYLDLCCFNRPYDDQTQDRIRLETAAKLMLQVRIREGECELLWSSILDYENANNPFAEHRFAIQQWRTLAVRIIRADSAILAHARELVKDGLSQYDALHVASAIAGGAAVFVSTDDRLLKRIRKRADIRTLLPGEALAFLESWYEN